MDCFNCLDPSLEVMGNHFLRASAGTGKTFAIEHIYRKLVQEGLKKEEILVVTFTHKAAKELVTRIGAHFPCLDHAAIYTIHGFCLRALEERTTFDLEEENPLQLILDYFRTKVAPPKFSKEEIHTLFKKCQYDFEKIVEAMKGGALELKLPSPHDLLVEMGEALKDPLFVQKMRERYQAVIIDEFQDTDPLQWEIFSTLFLNQVKAFYLVGDEKQSIYGFRNADLNVYFAAKEAFPKEQYLDTNFRSEPQLVEALNQFFAPLHYPPVKSREGGLNTVFQDGLGPLVLFSFAGKKGRSRSWPTKEMEQQYLFPFFAQEILKKEFPLGSWTILVRDRYQLERLRRYLSEKGIRVAAGGAGKLKESEAYLFLKGALEATKNPFDRRSLKRFMANPLMGWDVHKIEKGGLSFAFLSKVYQEEGFSGWAEAFLKWQVDEETLLAKLAKDLDVYSDAMQVIECGLEVDDQMEKMAIQDKEAVQLMTVHKSKGLEFEVVVALGVGTRTLHPDDDEEKLRLLYVALTRAKKRVYVPWLQETGKGKVAEGCLSPMEIYGTPPPFPQVDLTGKEFVFDVKEEEVSLCVQTFEYPPFASREILSFTSLARPHTHSQSLPEGTLPGGVKTGTEVHSLLEKIILEGWYTPFQDEKVSEKIRKGALKAWEKEVFEMVKKAFSLSLGDFSLADIPLKAMYPEIEFIYPEGQNFLTGFIDLVFEREGKIYLVDWKTNILEAYDQQGLQEGMERGDYFLQAKLYQEALRRYSPLPLGGLFYFFLRGGAVYHVR